LFTPRVIYGREVDSPYLSRWYIVGSHRESIELEGQTDEAAISRRPFSLYLHRFHRSDDDGALHSHPHAWGLSLVLAGGYSEERRVGDKVVRRLIKPWRLNFLGKDDYHRVDLIEHDAWTLFLVGPRIQSWFFWDRNSRCRAHWLDFIAAKRNGSSPKWEYDSRGGIE
jgi:hypothetical protein